MKTTFINQNAAGDLLPIAEDYMKGRIKDFEDFMKADDLEKAIMRNGETNNFFDYGLSFDYSEIDEKEKTDYFRYQLSWGGPSDEVRFYEDGTIEYVYLDWFCGVGFDVTNEDWARWLKDFYAGADMLNFQTEREKYDYCEILYSGDEDEDENHENEEENEENDNE